jgi:group I intron endonuclease
MIIYKAENLINHKVYVGKTSNTLEHRRWGHFSAARKGIKTIFHNAIRKYGIDCFKFSVLCKCSSSENLNRREKYFITTLDSMTPNGYNMTKGGDGLSKGSPGPNKGRVWPQEMRDRISKTLTGRKQSCETKEKRAESLKKSYREGRRTSWNKGLTKETNNSVASCAKKIKSRVPWNKGLKGFLKGKTSWNKGLTKKDHPSIANQANKISGFPAWNKGLTKETDERVAMYCGNNSSQFSKGHISWNKGLNVVHSEESNLKRSLTMKGKPKSERTIQNMIMAQQLRRSKERVKEAA